MNTFLGVSMDHKKPFYVDESGRYALIKTTNQELSDAALNGLVLTLNNRIMRLEKEIETKTSSVGERKLDRREIKINKKTIKALKEGHDKAIQELERRKRVDKTIL